jgi:hypothetical protein
MAAPEGLGTQARSEYVQVAPEVRLQVRDWGQDRSIVLIPGWPRGRPEFQGTARQIPSRPPAGSRW